MANKIIGKTDISGALNLGGITANSKRPVLVVGEGVDETKEVVFRLRGTADAATHFGPTSPCNNIIRALILNGVKVVYGICVGDVGTETQVSKTVAADEENNPIKDSEGNYTIIEDTNSYEGNTATVQVTELVGGAYASKAEAYAAAFKQSLADTEVMLIILDTCDSTIFDPLAKHLKDAEAADLYRYAVVGMPASVTDNLKVIEMAEKLNSDRMFIGFPNLVDDNNITLDGYMTAAGIASILNTKTDDPALPTNNIGVVGFGGVSSKIDEEAYTELMDFGVVPFVIEDGIPVIWRMVTTAQKSTGAQALESIWHDATTRLIADDVLSTVLAKLKHNYKRTKNVVRILNAIRTDIISVLDQKLAVEIIEEFDPNLVTVVKDPNDRYGALADFEYKVVSPLYTITVTQHIKI